MDENKNDTLGGEKFLIVDGSSLVHRAFYALPILTNPRGEFTNAVYGFATMMNRILAEQRPTKVVVCFDKSRTTFRTALFKEYKGHRGETPNELRPQFEYTKKLLEAMAICWEELPGFEADDIIGTLARLGSEGGKVLVLTGDRDSFQLVNPNTTVVLTKKGITQTELWDEAALYEKFALTPQQMIDLKALMGDASDNIPGIAGIGEKTALKLLAEYPTLDQVLSNGAKIKAKGLREKIVNGREQAELSKKLAIIDCFIPEYGTTYEDLAKYAYSYKPLGESPDLIRFYQDMGFHSLLKNVEIPAARQEQTEGQMASLFVDESLPEFSQLATAEELAQILADQSRFALSFYKATLGVALANGAVYTLGFAALQQAAATCNLGAILADPNRKKQTFMAKELLVRLAKEGLTLAGVEDDISLAAYLLDPVANSYQPHQLAVTYLEHIKLEEKTTAEEVVCALNTGLILPLAQIIKERLKAENLTKLYAELELPLTFVLADMELAGISVDKRVLQKMNLDLSAKEAVLTTEIYDLAGRSFNINSPKQLGEVLFQDLQISPLKKTKTGYSTDVEVLEQLSARYPIADKLLLYRSYDKLRATYAQGLQGLIEADGKIRTSFNQTVTATGRLSSTQPNLQNIPVRDELGRRLRAAFTASPDCLLLAADYSQIELRVLADIANDAVLQNSFIQEEDIHARTAAEVFGVPIDQVNKQQRRNAKAVNFGIVYGISDFGLAKDLGISRKEAKEYIDKYLEGYEGVRFYMTEIIQQGKTKGYVETLLGRKRWLPDLNNKNFNKRSFAERTALNTPIQGTAADIIKIAMLKVAKSLKAQGLQAKILLQVHDELILDVPLEELDSVKDLLKTEMEGAYPLAVPTTVDMKVGKDWYNMTAIEA